MSDLPRIKNDHGKLEIGYGVEAGSHLQIMFRKGSNVLADHITKNMAPVIEASFEQIPTTPGSDWGDLPSEVVKLKDGSYTKKLYYEYDDVKQGRSGTGAKRGVCVCADGKSKCDPSDKQRQAQTVGRPLRQSRLGRVHLHQHHQPGADGEAGEGPPGLLPLKLSDPCNSV